MWNKALISAVLFAAGAWAQAPVITSYETGVPGNTTYAPGTTLIIFGTFVSPSAGRDYTITVGGQIGGINFAGNAVFIAATIPVNASAGATTLVITYRGQASNALPITLQAIAPEITGVSAGIQSSTAPPAIQYRPFSHASDNTYVNASSPAALNEVLYMQVDGLGTQLAPAVAPSVTVGGVDAQVLQVTPSTGGERIYFGVPSNAPLGIDPVIVTVNGVASQPQDLPVGSGPAIGNLLNGASFGSLNKVAPGTIVSVFGANFGSQTNASAFPSTSVGGVSVLFGSEPAPILGLFGPSGQINVLVPTDIPTSGQLNLTVQTPGGTSPPVTLTVVEAEAGIFYYQDPLVPWRHNAVAVTANTVSIAMPASLAASLGVPTTCASAASLCAQPAKRGGYLQIYVTGLGVATPNGDPAGAPLASGSLAPASGNPLYLTLAQPTVTIGGQPAPMLFSGIAPGYNGLYQVDVQIPANIAPGDDVPLVLTQLGSTDTATIAVQ